jgi:hypothetical protein
MSYQLYQIYIFDCKKSCKSRESMNPRSIHDHVALHVRTDIVQFTAAIEVESVLNHIRKRNISDQIVYLMSSVLEAFTDFRNCGGVEYLVIAYFCVLFRACNSNLDS